MNFHTLAVTLPSSLNAACFSFQNPFSTLYYKASNLLGHFVFVSKNIFLVWPCFENKMSAISHLKCEISGGGLSKRSNISLTIGPRGLE